MKTYQIICSIFSVILTKLISATEFTFDLPAISSAEQCFYEMVQENVSCVFEFQVLRGGQLDVDVLIEGPDKNAIYKEYRKEYDTVTFNSTVSGEYIICFSNEFSTFTHKTIFMSFNAGNENPLFKDSEHITVMTFMESTAEGIHDSLEDVINAQTHYRLQEAHGRRFAEDLSERVLWWSMLQTFVILSIGLSQVLILRNFFNEPKSRNPLIQPRASRFTYVH